MKKIILVLSVFAVLLSGCRKDIFPLADFGVNYTTVQPNELVEFTNFSRDANRYSWDFGDGTYSNVLDPTHYYDREGTYLVTLTVESVDGNIDVATITIEVIYTLLADFQASSTKVQPDDIIQFTNYSVNGYKYTWDFGDGTYSNVPNPTHYYSNEGTYQVKLTIESVGGYIDVATASIEVIYTLLEVTAVEWNESETVQFLISYPFIALYNTLDDWVNDENAVVYGEGDEYGEITFAGLDSRRYYVWVDAVDEHGDVIYDNYNFYLESREDDYLRTQTMVPFALNTWVAWVDYLGDMKSAREKRREKYDLSKIKRDERSFIIVKDVSE